LFQQFQIGSPQPRGCRNRLVGGQQYVVDRLAGPGVPEARRVVHGRRDYARTLRTEFGLLHAVGPGGPLAEEVGEADRPWFNPLRVAQSSELRGRILAALSELSVEHRSVLILREVEGLSYKEIADSMDCPEGTVMSRLFHARKRMQELLADFADDATQEGA